MGFSIVIIIRNIICIHVLVVSIRLESRDVTAFHLEKSAPRRRAGVFRVAFALYVQTNRV